MMVLVGADLTVPVADAFLLARPCPRLWTDDQQRCAAAGGPAGTASATKPRLAVQMIAAALDAGVPASRVAGDEVYGNDPRLPVITPAASVRARSGP